MCVQNGCDTERRPSLSDDLATLETQRSKLLEEFLGLGDLRPGSITAVTRRCGKPSCHCAKHNDPGHDPQFRLTRRASGKTVTETFPNPTARARHSRKSWNFTASRNSARTCLVESGSQGRLDRFQIRPAVLPALPKHPTEQLVYFPRYLLMDRSSRFFSCSVHPPHSCVTGRSRQILSLKATRCRRLKPAAAIRSSGGRSAAVAVWLWPSRPLPGNSLQPPFDDRRSGAPGTKAKSKNW